MGIALFKERRFSERRKLSGLLPGKLVFPNAKGAVVCRAIDVAEHGLGVVANVEIALGSKAFLETEQRIIHFEVIWIAPDFGKQDMFRYGLISLDQDINIEELFIRSGCLK
jgi:hypothetical protein